MMSEKVIGHIRFVDGTKYLWCDAVHKLITPTPNDITMYAILANNDITLYGNRCEWDGFCFNFDCRYNKDKNVSTQKSIFKEIGEEDILSNENVKKIRKNLDELSRSVIEQ